MADADVAAGTAPASRARRLATWLYRRPGVQPRLLLATPLGWLALAYIGSLVILLLNAFWDQNSLSGRVIPFSWTLESFERLVSNEVYRTIAVRTILVAAAVTLTDALLAFPIAYYMARIASPRTRRILVIAVVMPLWAAYIVKIYAWRTILQPGGFLEWMLAPLGITSPSRQEILPAYITLSYLWLPYMIIPIYTGLERLPSSLLEASADLGARAGMTFRRVVLPLVLPAVMAGSIFTFSLTLGDYLTVALVSNTKFIGNVIYDNSALGSLPLAAAYSLLPIVIMVAYLIVMRRLGAFESL
ncbi:MAG TPA: ABC transporter permease [Candidatus Limnocylindria bacterium]|nr:ABC transporter permease [Candidatus Limnocylindria bacterium]